MPEQNTHHLQVTVNDQANAHSCCPSMSVEKEPTQNMSHFCLSCGDECQCGASCSTTSPMATLATHQFSVQFTTQTVVMNAEAHYVNISPQSLDRPPQAH